MIKNSVEQIAEPIGFDIANSDNITQSNLLNGIGRGFKLYPKDKLEIQLVYISQKTTKDADNFISSLAEIIKLKRE